MATKKVAASKSTSLVRWDEKFAKHAKDNKEQVKNIGTGGQSITFKPGAIYINKDTKVANNKLETVILGFCALNRWNAEAYDSSNPQPPDCYAFSVMVDDPEMGPPALPNRQSDKCFDCDKNVFGTATNGKGKACANTIRMGALTGKDCEDASSIAAAELYTAGISPTNLTHFKKYQDQVMEDTGRPLWAVVTEIQSQPDPKTQIRLEFKLVSLIEDDEVLTALEKRVEKIQEALQKPFSAPTDRKPPIQAGGNKKFAAKKAVGRR